MRIKENLFVIITFLTVIFLFTSFNKIADVDRRYFTVNKGIPDTNVYMREKVENQSELISSTVNSDSNSADNPSHSFDSAISAATPAPSTTPAPLPTPSPSPAPANKVDKKAVSSGPVVFLGDSITQGLDLYGFFPDSVNKGVNSLTICTAANYIDELTELNPSKLFILLGTNDLWGAVPEESIESSYRRLLSVLEDNLPGTELYIQSIFPVGPAALERNPLISNEKIDNTNKKLKELSDEFKIPYLDVNTLLKDENGQLSPESSIDGVHILFDCYHIWTDLVSQYIQ